MKEKRKKKTKDETPETQIALGSFETQEKEYPSLWVCADKNNNKKGKVVHLP